MYGPSFLRGKNLAQKEVLCRKQEHAPTSNRPGQITEKEEQPNLQLEQKFQHFNSNYDENQTVILG